MWRFPGCPDGHSAQGVPVACLDVLMVKSPHSRPVCSSCWELILVSQAGPRTILFDRKFFWALFSPSVLSFLVFRPDPTGPYYFFYKEFGLSDSFDTTSPPPGGQFGPWALSWAVAFRGLLFFSRTPALGFYNGQVGAEADHPLRLPQGHGRHPPGPGGARHRVVAESMP